MQDEMVGSAFRVRVYISTWLQNHSRDSRLFTTVSRSSRFEPRSIQFDGASRFSRILAVASVVVTLTACSRRRPEVSLRRARRRARHSASHDLPPCQELDESGKAIIHDRMRGSVGVI